MPLFQAEDKPKLNPQKDWKGFPSDPVELLLLAHIDGKNTVKDLSGVCARTVELTVMVLDKLGGMSILASPRAGAPSRTVPPSSAPAPEAPVAQVDGMMVDRRFLRQLSEIDTSVLAEKVDLEPRRKEEVLLLFHSLPRLTPFQLFGISGTATDRDVKRAYQRLSMRFHPDRYYGKDMGSFKNMMERIFRVISESLEMLSTEESRQKLAAVYPDAFSVDVANSQPVVDSLAPVLQDAIHDDARDSVEIQPGPRRHHSRVGLRNQIANVLARANSNSVVSGDSDDGAQPREELVLPPKGGYRTAPTRHDPMHRAAQERAQRVGAHLSEGKRALETKNFSTAASHFKMVLSLDPRHEEAGRLYQEADSKNREILGLSYAARARMEEEMRDLHRASELWSLAVELSPILEFLIAAAQCFSRLGNHTKAREYALRAVGLSPKPEVGLVLAQVYINAGMGLRAQSTLKEILEKAPSHPEALRMMREAKKL